MDKTNYYSETFPGYSKTAAVTRGDAHAADAHNGGGRQLQQIRGGPVLHGRLHQLARPPGGGNVPINILCGLYTSAARFSMSSPIQGESAELPRCQAS